MRIGLKDLFIGILLMYLGWLTLKVFDIETKVAVMAVIMSTYDIMKGMK